MTRSVVVHDDPEHGAAAVARRLTELAAVAIRARGRFVLGVSGGGSPEPLFRALARTAPAAGWWLFWADERLVPWDDERSNYGLARRLWLAPAGFPAANTGPVRTDGTAGDAAARYHEALGRFFAADRPAPGTSDGFDALVLGVGPDGHTASLFPGSSTLGVSDRWATAELRPSCPPLVPRITLTVPAIDAARRLLFLAWGAEKRPILERVLGDGSDAPASGTLPAARVRGVDGVEWHVDRAAWPGR